MSEWKEYTVEQLIELGMLEAPIDGNHGSIHPKSTDFVSSGVPFIMVNNMSDGNLDLKNCAFISEEQAATLRKGFAKPGDVLLSHKATIGKTAIVPNDYDTIILTPQITYYRIKRDIDNRFLKYYFDSSEFQNLFSNWACSGSTRAYLGITAQRKLPIKLPEIDIQVKIANLLSSIDEKINNNNKINNNLEEQAMAIFNNIFPNTFTNDKFIGDFITPKRGKSLLSKNAVSGDVPVVAGGLKPSTYHNVANTVAPVITISASGANAGYVGLWDVPVWSSDSSFIDSSMTENVYFWYTMLRSRQQEIFDAQTGSAQPHIYPQHIAAMPVYDLNNKDIQYYNSIVTPIFETIGHNDIESKILSELRDTLLPKLMSGEIDVSKLTI